MPNVVLDRIRKMHFEPSKGRIEKAATEEAGGGGVRREKEW
jgi:hypothetical protein